MKTLTNSAQLIGRIGNTLEIKTFESGKKVLNFSLATNEYYKDKNGEKVKETTWHNIVAWENVADLIANACHKGDEIALQGKLTNRKYQHEGVEKFTTEVNVREFLRLRKASEIKEEEAANEQ